MKSILKGTRMSGKTTWLIWNLINFVRNNKRVLYIAPHKHAVEIIKMSLKSKLTEEEMKNVFLSTSKNLIKGITFDAIFIDELQDMDITVDSIPTKDMYITETIEDKISWKC